jgi:hypothetical protein
MPVIINANTNSPFQAECIDRAKTLARIALKPEYRQIIMENK